MTASHMSSSTPTIPKGDGVCCPCGFCPECRSNAKWDRIFAKFEVKDYGDVRGISRSPLSDLLSGRSSEVLENKRGRSRPERRLLRLGETGDCQIAGLSVHGSFYM